MVVVVMIVVVEMIVMCGCCDGIDGHDGGRKYTSSCGDGGGGSNDDGGSSGGDGGGHIKKAILSLQAGNNSPSNRYWVKEVIFLLSNPALSSFSLPLLPITFLFSHPFVLLTCWSS